MKQSLDHVRNAYDLAASPYADTFLNELEHKPKDRELLLQFAESVGSGQRVLDLGCGPGHTTAHLASLGLDPVGVDLSPQMVAKGRELFPAVDFHVGNFFQLANSDQSVAGVLAFYCIVHLRSEQLVAVFQEMFRVLQDGGLLLLSFHVGTETIVADSFLDTGAALAFSPFAVDDVQSALRDAGFTGFKVHQRDAYDSEHPTTRCYIFASRHQ